MDKSTGGIYKKHITEDGQDGNRHPTSEGNYVAILRTDGRSRPGEKHHGCRYFVLEPGCGNPATNAALDAYANACEAVYPQLAKDLCGDEVEMWEYFILDLDHDPFAGPAVAAFETESGRPIPSDKETEN